MAICQKQSDCEGRETIENMNVIKLETVQQILLV